MKNDKILTPQTESLNKETVCFKVPAKNMDGKQFLVVPEGWEAVCLHDGQLGKVLKRGKYKISTLKAKSHLFEVLFYPILSEFSFLWGTKDQMDFSDPVYSLPVKMGANGRLVFLIRNIRNVYLTSNQPQNVSTTEIKAQVMPSLLKFIQEKITSHIKENKLSFLDFEKNKDKIFKDMFASISFFVQNEFGLKVSNFLVDGIIFDKKLFTKLEKERLKEEKEFEQKNKTTNQIQNALRLENQVIKLEEEKNIKKALSTELTNKQALQIDEAKKEEVRQEQIKRQEAETKQQTKHEEKEMLLL